MITIRIIFLIFLLPILKEPSEYVSRLVLGIVVISGIFAAEYNKRVLRVLLLLGAVVLIALILGLIFPDARSVDVAAFLLLTCSFVFSTTALVAHVAGSKRVDKSTILCAINSYLLIGLSGSVIIFIIDMVVPNSLTNLTSGLGELSNYIYFGFVTLSTLGYGDISPATPLARSFSTFLALSGQLYLVIIMALIIGKYLNSKNKEH